MSTVSPFISAMDASVPSNNKTLGENGSPEYTASGVKDARVALFFALVRGLPSDRLRMLLKDVFKTAKEDEKVEAVADTFVLAFQTRNCRGGKGERDLFYTLLSELSVDYPQTVSSLLSLIPHYGSYKDWFQLVDLIQDKKNTNLTEQVRNSMTPMVDKIFDLAKNQLIDDARILHEKQNKSSSNSSSSSSGGLSLLAKWAPREKKQYDKQAKQLARMMFPDSQTPKKDYRKLVSELNSAINTVETKMSSNKWDKIDFGSEVPSVCLMKNRKAFMNEEVKGSPPLESENDTGNRHPDNEVRVSCRKRLRDALVEKDGKKLKGRQLFPHEIASKFMNSGYGSQKGQTSELEKEILASQWKDIREGVKESMVKVSDQGSSQSPPVDKGPPSVDLGKLVSLVDVSGSMSGTPMEVAIALGLLTSELASPEFADRCLTFSATPEWVDLSSLSLVEKVERMQRANWGMNTDFEAAIEKILDIAINAKLKPDDIPNLIVFSDMQFDQARMQDSGYGGRWGGYGGGSQSQTQEMATAWETHHEKIVRRFKESGLRVCGKEWPSPHIIYWNLRGDTTGFPAQADTPGVTMLSGFSPAMMKLVLSGEPLVMEDAGTGEKKQRDPYTTLRAALDDKDYDKVRNVLDSSEEGVLKLYEKKLEPEPLESEGTDEGDDWELVKP